MILYLASLVMSITTAVMTIIIMNRGEEFKFFGDTELCAFLVISIVLLLIGIIHEKGDK